MQGGGGPAEPVLSKQSVLADAVKSNVKDGAPAPVRASETGRARNWTMPPLRLERECKERPNSATIDNRCVEFDRRESTESTAIIGLRALGRRIAFTMAEILLSLTIIGVVAAITLPSLTGNINERTWNTQRKALYARFSQAIALMPALNGYGTLQEMTDSTTGSTSIEDTAAETFVTSGLSKVLKINNICDSEHLEDCGMSEKITTINADNIDFPRTIADLNPVNTSVNESHINSDSGNLVVRYYSAINAKAAAFETANGESIAVYYNPNCLPSMGESGVVYAASKICANFLYDLNGAKGPNTVGKDIGMMTVYYPTDSLVVAPMPYSHDASVNVATDGINGVCKALNDDYRAPTIEELGALSFNRNLIGNLSASRYASSSFLSSAKKWYMASAYGLLNVDDAYSGNSDVRCVKR